MAPLAAYAGSWGTGSPSPNIVLEEWWRKGDGGGGIGERSRSAGDETFAVPQPGAHQKPVGGCPHRTTEAEGSANAR
jgi:hypothetical protein